MSLNSDIQKILDFVIDETKRFVTTHNGGILPGSAEIAVNGHSYEISGDTALPNTSNTYFVWERKHVLKFETTWLPTVSVKATEIPVEQWPDALKLKLAHSIDLITPDGATRKIL